jgi:DNA-binding winged helix-turn-helix (wHTH) protein/Flp pilus assembly protein TadD
MLTIGDTVFDASARRLLRGNQEFNLSPKAAGVLTALAETPGQVWSREALLERVWPDVHVGDEVLTHALSELRRAFGDDRRNPRYFATVHKSGYRLLASVTCAPAGAASKPSPQNPVSLDGYANYLVAVDLYERGGRQNTEAAVEMFTQIVRAHSEFALAHVGLAKALTFLETYYRSENSVLSTALDHCAAAHRITSGSAEAFAAEGFVYAIFGDNARSARCFQAAVNLRPYDAETHYLLGRASVAELETRFAVLMFERAVRLRPDDYRTLLMAGKLRQAMGDTRRATAYYAAAIDPIETQLGQDPSDVRALRGKARSLWQLGMRDEAFELMETLSKQPDPLNYQLACALARAGATDRALDALEEAVDLGWRHKAWLDRDPDWDSLRADRRFNRIAASIPAPNPRMS